MSTEASNRILAELIAKAAELHRELKPELRQAVGGRLVWEVARIGEQSQCDPGREVDSD